MSEINQVKDELQVLSLISDSRATYGLRSNDYERYRGYCSRKILRLRKGLKIVQTGDKLKENKIIDDIELLKLDLNKLDQDVRYFQLLIFQIEKCWSYAMDLKSLTNAQPRKHFHLVSRLKKACQYAEFLDEISSLDRVDIINKLEITSYCHIIRGNYQFEKKDYLKALECFIAARTVLIKLASSENTSSTNQALYFSLIDLIEPNLRFCSYNLELDQMDDDNNLDKVYELNHEVKVKLLGNVLELMEGLKQLDNNDTQYKTNLEWFDHNIQLNSSEIIRLIHKAKSVESNLDHSDLEIAMSSFDEAIGAYADATELAKKLKQENQLASDKIQTTRTIELGNNLQLLETCVQIRQFSGQAMRNFYLCKPHYQIEEGDIPKLKLIGSAEEVIRLVDGALQSLNQITKLSMMDLDYNLEQWLILRISFFKSLRFIFIGLNQTDLIKCYNLYQQAYKELSQFEDLNQINYDNPFDLLVSNLEINQFRNITRQLIQSTHAKYAMDNKDNELVQDLNKLCLNDQYLPSVLDTLTKYPTDFDNLIKLPIQPQPVFIKPLVFDLAFNPFNPNESIHQSLIEKINQNANITQQNDNEPKSVVLNNIFKLFG